MSILFQQLRENYDIYLITPFDGRYGRIDLPEFVTHIKISNQYFYDSFDYIASSFALLFDIDVVIGFMNLFDKQLDLYGMCKELNIKTIASNHEIYLYPYRSPYHYDLVKKRLDVFADVNAALWLTNFSTSIYSLANNNGFLIPNPNTYKTHQIVSDKRKEKVILCVGRFNDYIKRVDRILSCFSLVLKKQPDAKLVLVGKYDRTAPFKPNSGITIDNIINDLKIDDRKITFVGEVNDVEAYYKQASLLLLASNNEGFGMVINEAASFGVPSVCNKIPGLEDLVIDNKNGYLVDQDDIETMANRVCEILSDDNLRNKLGKNAQKYVEKFDADKIGDRWRCLIDSVIEGDTTSIIRKKLDEMSPPKDIDYEDLSRILFNELNDTLYELTNKETSKDFESYKEFKIYSYYNRLKGSIRSKGMVKTSKIILKKVYKKIKR